MPAAESPKKAGVDASAASICRFEDIAEGERTGKRIHEGNAQQHENIADAGGHEGFDGRIPSGWFSKPEADQQVRAQPHDLPADEEGQQVIGNHQRVHAEGEQADKGKEARIHRLDGRDRCACGRVR